MNAKQRKFAVCYALTMNATQSAIESGYKKETAYSQGSRLLKNVEIQKLIKEEIQKQEAALPSRLEIMRFWADIMRDKNAKLSQRLSASTNLAKAKYMFNSDVWE